MFVCCFAYHIMSVFNFFLNLLLYLFYSIFFIQKVFCVYSMTFTLVFLWDSWLCEWVDLWFLWTISFSFPFVDLSFPPLTCSFLLYFYIIIFILYYVIFPWKPVCLLWETKVGHLNGREGTLESRYTMWENNLFLITEQNRGIEPQKQLKTSEILVQLGEAQERMLTECKRERGCYAGKKTKKMLKINTVFHYDGDQARSKSLCLHSKKIGNLLRGKQ